MIKYIQNHKQHNDRISNYKPNSFQEAINMIYNLNKNNFNNYGQMVKDIKLICEEVMNGNNKIND